MQTSNWRERFREKFNAVPMAQGTLMDIFPRREEIIEFIEEVQKESIEQAIEVVENAGENSVGLLDPNSEDSKAFGERFISQGSLIKALKTLLH